MIKHMGNSGYMSSYKLWHAYTLKLCTYMCLNLCVCSPQNNTCWMAHHFFQQILHGTPVWRMTTESEPGYPACSTHVTLTATLSRQKKAIKILLAPIGCFRAKPLKWGTAKTGLNHWGWMGHSLKHLHMFICQSENIRNVVIYYRLYFCPAGYADLTVLFSHTKGYSIN